MTMRWQQHTRSFIWTELWQVCIWGKSLTAGALPEVKGEGYYPEEAEGKGKSGGKRIRESVMNLDGFAQQHNGESLGQRALKGLLTTVPYLIDEQQILGTVLRGIQSKHALNEWKSS